MHHIRLPCPALAPYIHVFWISENALREHGRERVLPTGTMQVIINLHDEPMRSSQAESAPASDTVTTGIAAGARTGHLVIDTASIVACLGIVFRPGGAAPFFRVPVSAFRNELVPLELLWQDDAALQDRLVEAGTPALRFQVLERYLVDKLHHNVEAIGHSRAFVSHAVRHLSHWVDARSLARLKAECGYGNTRFTRLFGDSVGLTPNQFLRIRRFQRSLNCLFLSREADWADLALAHGYYDQAHFIHEFKAFTGITPGSYFSKRIEEINHLAF